VKTERFRPSQNVLDLGREPKDINDVLKRVDRDREIGQGNARAVIERMTAPPRRRALGQPYPMHSITRGMYPGEEAYDYLLDPTPLDRQRFAKGGRAGEEAWDGSYWEAGMAGGHGGTPELEESHGGLGRLVRGFRDIAKDNLSQTKKHLSATAPGTAPAPHSRTSNYVMFDDKPIEILRKYHKGGGVPMDYVDEQRHEAEDYPRLKKRGPEKWPEINRSTKGDRLDRKDDERLYAKGGPVRKGLHNVVKGLPKQGKSA
jgi:hypothetical protein